MPRSSVATSRAGSTCRSRTSHGRDGQREDQGDVQHPNDGQFAVADALRDLWHPTCLSGRMTKSAPSRCRISRSMCSTGLRAPTVLHNSTAGRTAPFPGQTHPSASVTGMPSAVSRSVRRHGSGTRRPDGRGPGRSGAVPAASHNAFGLDAASAVVSAPSYPDRPAEAFRRAQRLVPCDCSGSVGLPRPCVWAGGMGLLIPSRYHAGFTR